MVGDGRTAMTGLFVALGAVAALALGVVGYAGWRMGQPPAGSPAEFLAKDEQPSGLPVLVCLGDSITQAGLGADWVAGLRQALEGEAVVVNAGVGGQVAWDLRQRLDEVARCRPDAVVLMVGSNDAVGALGGPWTSFYESGRPQAPTEDWFAQEYEALVEELALLTPKLVCLTLSPLGEDPEGAAEAIVRRQNEAIRAIAADRGVDLVDLHPALLKLRQDLGASGDVPFMSGPLQFMRWGLASTIRHRILGQSWDAIGQSRGLSMSADTIHPNDRSGSAMLALVEPWARRALSLRSAP